MKILILNGPNLGLLGRREPGQYGTRTLDAILRDAQEHARSLGIETETFQSDSEGALVSRIGQAMLEFDGIVINPAAYTHTSVAVRDAIAATGLPAVEVHLSNVYKREEFRHRSLTAPVCLGQIAGFGGHGYILAIEALARHLSESESAPAPRA